MDAKKITTRIIHAIMEQTTFPDGTTTMRPIRFMQPHDMIELPEVRRMNHISMRQLRHLCDCGFYKTARKKNPDDPNSQWLVSRGEVIERHLM